MIDAVPPSSQQIVQKMVDCGIDRPGIVVQVDNEDVGIIINVRREARVPADRFACIQQATKTAAVFFDDPALQRAYRSYVLDRARPAMLASAKDELARRGLLDHVPRRSDYRDVQDYAHSLERYGGVAPGSMLQVSGKDVTVGVVSPMKTPADFERMTAVMALLMYAIAIGDVDGMGFVGNAAATDPAGSGK